MAVANTQNVEQTNLPATQVDSGIATQLDNDAALQEDVIPNPIAEKFNALPRNKQIQLLVGIAATLAILIVVFMWTRTPDFRLLYGDLTEQASSEIVEVLRAQNFKYQLDEKTGQILVSNKEIHDIRILLAGLGLPTSEEKGFELLDQDQGFGTSQFMEKARYHRALEGELAKSIKQIDSVETARVHLAIPRQSVFIRNRQHATASVLASLKPGRSLSDGQVAAIVHLVASSIPNLDSGNVTVVDQTGKLISNRHNEGSMGMSAQQFEYKQKVEDYYIERIERILTPIVGFEGVRAQVDADLDFSIVESTQELFNPDLPAIRSEQTMEEESRGGDIGGVPGALTNQPPGVATAPEIATDADGNKSTSPSRKSKRATFNYELDKTISHTKRAPGQLERLSVAVVIDDKLSYGENGEIIRKKYAPEQLEEFSNLIRKAVGFNPARGDSINLVNASFRNSSNLPPLPEGPLWEQQWFLDLVKQGAGLLVFLLILGFVVRPVVKAWTHKEEEPEEEVEELIELTPEQLDEKKRLDLEKKRPGGLSPEDWAMLGVSHEEYVIMLEKVRKMAEDDPLIVAQVVKTWCAVDEISHG